jgi:hypothetical protein
VATIFHPGLGRTLRYDVQVVDDDPDVQVAQVIDIMSGHVERDSQDPAVIAQAQQALALGNGDPLQGVFDLVRSQLRFTRDEKLASPVASLYSLPFVETFIPPSAMARMCDGDASGRPCVRQGDCDDYAMYAAALLRALGVKARFVTVAADSRDPEQYTHVYLAAYPAGGGRIPMDVSHGDYVGWEHEGNYKLKEWDIGPGRHNAEWLLIGAAILGGYVAYRKGWLN